MKCGLTSTRGLSRASGCNRGCFSLSIGFHQHPKLLKNSPKQQVVVYSSSYWRCTQSKQCHPGNIMEEPVKLNLKWACAQWGAAEQSRPASPPGDGCPLKTGDSASSIKNKKKSGNNPHGLRCADKCAACTCSPCYAIESDRPVVVVGHFIHHLLSHDWQNKSQFNASEDWCWICLFCLGFSSHEDTNTRQLFVMWYKGWEPLNNWDITLTESLSSHCALSFKWGGSDGSFNVGWIWTQVISHILYIESWHSLKTTCW